MALNETQKNLLATTISFTLNGIKEIDFEEAEVTSPGGTKTTKETVKFTDDPDDPLTLGDDKAIEVLELMLANKSSLDSKITFAKLDPAHKGCVEQIWKIFEHPAPEKRPTVIMHVPQESYNPRTRRIEIVLTEVTRNPDGTPGILSLTSKNDDPENPMHKGGYLETQLANLCKVVNSMSDSDRSTSNPALQLELIRNINTKLGTTFTADDYRNMANPRYDYDSKNLELLKKAISRTYTDRLDDTGHPIKHDKVKELLQAVSTSITHINKDEILRLYHKEPQYRAYTAPVTAGDVKNYIKDEIKKRINAIKEEMRNKEIAKLEVETATIKREIDELKASSQTAEAKATTTASLQARIDSISRQIAEISARSQTPETPQAAGVLSSAATAAPPATAELDEIQRRREASDRRRAAADALTSGSTTARQQLLYAALIREASSGRSAIGIRPRATTTIATTPTASTTARQEAPRTRFSSRPSIMQRVMDEADAGLRREQNSDASTVGIRPRTHTPTASRRTPPTAPAPTLQELRSGLRHSNSIRENGAAPPYVIPPSPAPDLAAPLLRRYPLASTVSSAGAGPSTNDGFPRWANRITPPQASAEPQIDIETILNSNGRIDELRRAHHITDEQVRELHRNKLKCTALSDSKVGYIMRMYGVEYKIVSDLYDMSPGCLRYLILEENIRGSQENFDSKLAVALSTAGALSVANAQQAEHLGGRRSSPPPRTR